MLDLTQRLKEKDISYSALASMISEPRSTINHIVKGNYKGREETKKRILSKIELVLSDKEDLNPVLYENAKLTRKVFWNAMKSHKFNLEESKIIADVVTKLDEYIKKNKKIANPESI